MLTRLVIRGTFCCAVLFIFSCKKKQEFNNETGQATVDNRFLMAEHDEVIKEINTIISDQYLLRGRLSAASLSDPVCGATVDTLGVLSGSARIRYNGAECFGRTRSGEVRFKIEGYPLKKWKHPGTVISIEFVNYKVRRTSDTRVVTINGVEKLTNLTGNTWFELWYDTGHPNVSYALSGSDIRVTYDENALAILNLNRKMTYSYSGNVTTCRVEGLGSAEGRTQLENWGQGRDGLFYTQRIYSPVVWSTACGAIAALSGETGLQLNEREYEMKCRYGIDAAGNQVSTGCPYGYEMTWKRKKRTNSRKFGYY